MLKDAKKFRKYGVFGTDHLCTACVPHVRHVFRKKIDFWAKISEYSRTKNG